MGAFNSHVKFPMFILSSSLIFTLSGIAEARATTSVPDQSGVPYSSLHNALNNNFRQASPQSLMQTTLRIPFVENRGQLQDTSVRFFADTFAGRVLVTDKAEIVYDLGLRESFEGSGQPDIKGQKTAETRISYFLGNRDSWRTNVETWQEVRFGNVYKGIDLDLKAAYGNTIEKIFTVHPEGSVADIRLRFDGAQGLSVRDNGELTVQTRQGTVTFTRPVAYQRIGDRRIEVDVEYMLISSPLRSSLLNEGLPPAGQAAHEEGFVYAFKVGDYDHTAPLVIDPVLSYSTYLGGSNVENPYDIAVDQYGNTYITGVTGSLDFPVTPNPLQDTNRGTGDGDPSCNLHCNVFIAKIGPTGTDLVYATYLGGTNMDSARGIAVDASGSVYITGYTYSTDFPTQTPLQLDSSHVDTFIAKVNPEGTELAYSTYLGGNSHDYGMDIAIDASGNAYVTGYTMSSDFPTTPGSLQTAKPSYGYTDNDGYVAKISADATALVYSTYLGSPYYVDYSLGIAVDRSGSAYVAGYTEATSFPTTPNSFQPLKNGAYTDAFITKLDPGGTRLEYSTYLGGTSYDYARGIAVDIDGNAYVTGETSSRNFPMQTPVQSASGGDTEAFVTKLNAEGSALSYSTYLGGNSKDYGRSIAVDGQGNAYVTGETYSTSFPVLNYLQRTNGSSTGATTDAFVTKYNAAGTARLYSTYLGGGGSDGGRGIAADCAGNASVVGYSYSGNFPTVNPLQTLNPGFGGDAVVFRIGNDQPLVDLAIAKTDSRDPLLTGEQLTYTITASNTCYGTAGDVTITDSLPAGVTYVSATSTAGSCSELHGIVTCDIGQLSGNSTATVSIEVIPNVAGMISNTAVVTAIDAEATPADNTVTETTRVDQGYTMTIRKAGTGSGTVLISGPGGPVACGDDCQETYPAGIGIQLDVVPAADSVFTGWSGDPGCADAVVLMAADTTCTATFDLLSRRLIVGKPGTGSGTVTSTNVPGIDCGNDCSELYPIGTTIALQAVPDQWNDFSWGGDADCDDGEVTIGDTDVTCFAVFDIRFYTLTLTKGGDGRGVVMTDEPDGMDCGLDCDSVDKLYTAGSAVTLTAGTAPPWQFARWDGDPDCLDGAVQMNADKTCTAIFTIESHSLTITKTGGAASVVTLTSQDVEGIVCGADCSETYQRGTRITLGSAEPLPDNISLFWSGDPDCADGVVTIGAADIACEASFTYTYFVLTIENDGTGEGRVFGEMSWGCLGLGVFSCGESQCSTMIFPLLDSCAVTLTGSPGEGSAFLGFTGDADCTDGNLTMQTDLTCIATFTTLEDLQFEQMQMLRAESRKPPEFRIEHGIPRFVSMRLPISAAVPDDPVLQALDFLDRYSYLYRISEPTRDLYLQRIRTNRFREVGGGNPDPSNIEQHLFFGQIMNGIPVHGASLAVHMRGDMITSTSGNYLTKPPTSTLPTVTSAAAEAIALAGVRGTDKVVIGQARLFYFSRTLTARAGGDPAGSDPPARLAWRVTVRGLRASDGAGTSWKLFIDARDGTVLSNTDELQLGEPQKDFDIQSAANTESGNCWARTDVAGTADWFNENGPTGNYPGLGGDQYGDGQQAYDFSHATYDFYHSNFYRHSWYDIDDFWNTGEAEVDVWVHVGADWRNASYRPDCDHLTFGDGYMGTDTYAHEYTHAVTRWSANLEYQNQSGALNESYSDVMAALLDGDWLEGEENPIRGEDGERGGTAGGSVGDGSREREDECGNGRDDDGDAFVDEGCPETGIQCDGLDNDGDGFTDEGCPETGLQCGDGDDDDADGYADEGCPGSCQDGIDNGLTGESDSDDTECFNRDLANPGRKSDPDHRAASLSGDGTGLRILGFDEPVICDSDVEEYNDCGYVHTNSGIPNKAAYLLTVGGVHVGSGIAVAGIGSEKAMRLYYDVLTSRLGVNSEFYDARDATIEQVREYVDADRHGFVQSDVCSVMNAFAAVGYGDSDIDCDGVLDRDSTDNDADSLLDAEDNCPQTANLGQEDIDGDRRGDSCDLDMDEDGVDNIFDNCPSVANADQDDGDIDTLAGAACEDHDGDGVLDAVDNCPNDVNPDQMDNFGSALGDACETDGDNDGIDNDSDNCSAIANASQADWDDDDIGDACDNCIHDPNDNQRDMDNDDIGDVCDDDTDGDGITNADDQCPENALPIFIVGGSEVLPCTSNADLADLLSGDHGAFVHGELFFPSLTASIKIPVFPCLDDGCADWIAENYLAEVSLSLPVSYQARIIDDQGYAVRKGFVGAQQALRFHPAADSFFRFLSTSMAGAQRSLSEVSAYGATQAVAYEGRHYFLEIYPSADVVAGERYPFTIRVLSRLIDPLDVDDDGYPVSADCNDRDAAIHPGAVEVCDGEDNNCDGQADEGILLDDHNACTEDKCDPVIGVYHMMIDPDDGNACTEDRCDPVLGVYHLMNNPDDGNACTEDRCDPVLGVYHLMKNPDDSNACTEDGCHPVLGIYHMLVDVDDGDDCTQDTCDPVSGVRHAPLDAQSWYRDGDNDGYSTGFRTESCTRPDGYRPASELASLSGDCDDTKAAIRPGALEACDGVDNDCDGQADEGCPVSAYRISGGAYFFPDTPLYRASFSMDISGPSSPSGWLKYYYTRTRMYFVSTSLTSVTVAGNAATISGSGTVNGAGGYSFTATVTNGSPDGFAIGIRRPDGSTYYSAGPKNVSGGDLAIQ